MKVTAQYIEIILNDDEGLCSIFIDWGQNGQYISFAREENSDFVYCEFFDQSNGVKLIPSLIKYFYKDRLLIFEVESPETFLPGQKEHYVEINLGELKFDENDINASLKKLFRG